MTASTRFLGIAPHQCPADVACRADAKEESLEVPADPVPREKGHLASHRLLKGTLGCRSNLRRSSGKVGQDKHSAEDRITLLMRPSCVSCATKADTWHEIAPIEAQVARPHKEREHSGKQV